MADCDRAFKKYHRTVKLDTGGYRKLRKYRDRIRRLVAGYFKTHRLGRPVFKTQGSFVHRTIIRPLSGEFDLDDGLYLKGLGNSLSSWPAPALLLRRVHASVQGRFPGHTRYCRACIEVKKPGRYRVQLPVFAYHRQRPWVADTGPEGWHKSDTGQLDAWLAGRFKQHGAQLKRLVCYIKAWADVQQKKYDLPSNLILTLYLVTEYQPDRCDDRALAATVKKIARRVKRSYKLVNPMEPEELMTRRLTARQKKDGRAALTSLARTAEQALAAGGIDEALKLWREQFGKRFIGS